MPSVTNAFLSDPLSAVQKQSIARCGKHTVLAFMRCRLEDQELSRF